MGAETLWIKEKADGIYPRISRADGSPTWVWQGDPWADSCRAIPRLHVQPPSMPHIKGRELDLACLRIPVPLAHTCAKGNEPSQGSQGKRKSSEPQGHGSYNLQRVHKSPNSHLPNISPESTDAGATILFSACWNKALPLSGRLHSEGLTPTMPSPYQALRDRSQPDINYCWRAQGHTGDVQNWSISGCHSLFPAMKHYLLVMGGFSSNKSSPEPTRLVQVFFFDGDKGSHIASFLFLAVFIEKWFFSKGTVKQS